MADAISNNDGSNDPFGPPHIPTDVCCLHCGEEYQSYLIEWRVDTDEKGHWCCPTDGCSGAGFGFDILPTDPAWRSEDGQSGWRLFDDDDEADDAPLDDDAPWISDEPNDPDAPSSQLNDEDIFF